MFCIKDEMGPIGLQCSQDAGFGLFFEELHFILLLTGPIGT